MPDPSRDYLTQLLEQYWFAPPVALWRAVEMRILAAESFPRPILDLGCGDGLIARVLFAGEAAVDQGFDPWFDQVCKAPNSQAYTGVQQAFGDAMPYHSHRFATVFSNSVLEHIPNLAPVVRETARVLQPGGNLLVTVPSDYFRQLLDGYSRRAAVGDVEGAEAYARTVDRRLAHHRYLSPQEWEEILQPAGMQLMRTRYYVPAEVAAVWDRANTTYGIHENSWPFFRWLASPRLKKLGYQNIIKKVIVRRLSTRWRLWYEMDVPEGAPGAGLLVIAEKGKD